MAKQLQVLADLGDSRALENLMWLVGVMQDHNIISGGLRERVRQYYAEKLHHAVDQTTGLLAQALSERGRSANVSYHRCQLNESFCPYATGKSFYIILYNPLAWNVTLPVHIPVEKRQYSVFGPDDDVMEAALLPIPSPPTSQTHELVFRADAPALGHVSYYIQLVPARRRRNLRVRPIRQTDYDETTRVVTSEDVKDAAEEIRTAQAEPPEDQNQEDKVSGEERDKDTPSVASYAEESSDDFIRNQYIQINLDKHKKISSMTLSNGVNTTLDIQFYYYVSDDPYKMAETKNLTQSPEKFKPNRKNPGTYIMRTMDLIPVPILDVIETKVYKSEVVQEIHTRYTNYTSFVVRLYDDRPVVEVDWLLRAVPVADELGKEVFVRYTTGLGSNGVFYTDANGRQTVKRIRNTRATYVPFNLDLIAGNIYPVTSRIYIEDLKSNMRFSLFTDRPQGGTSLHDGALDLMLQRRLFTDDAGFHAWLNGSDADVVRGTHHLYLTKANHKPNRIFEKKFAKEIELRPRTFVAHDNATKTKWLTMTNEFSALKTKLPVGVHVLTIERWEDDTMLLRLENYLEKFDAVRNGIKTVTIKDLFANITIIKLRETTLAGHMWVEDWTPLQWQLKEDFYTNFNEFYGNDTLVDYVPYKEFKPVDKVDLDKGIKLTPQQIRTFVVWYEYK